MHIAGVVAALVCLSLMAGCEVGNPATGLAPAERASIGSSRQMIVTTDEVTASADSDSGALHGANSDGSLRRGQTSNGLLEQQTAAERLKPETHDLGVVQFGGPLVIQQGGVYRGAWESNDPNTPAVRIATREPVVIDRAKIRSRGNLIETSIDGVNLVVRRSVGHALNPGQFGARVGRFLTVRRPRRIVVENNELVGTTGIFVDGYGGNWTPNDGIRVIGNIAVNIDGRASTAAGFSTIDTEAHPVSFITLAGVHRAPTVDIGWNHIVNQPYKSRVEDVISMYLSSGTATNPIVIHDNFVNGAYPADPVNDTEYSGGGIMLGDGRADPDGVRHVVGEHNIVVSTTNHGMAISAGEHVTMRANRIFQSGRLDDGTMVKAGTIGVYVWNLYEQEFSNNSAVNNVVRSDNPGGVRHDYWLPDVSRSSGNISYEGRVTKSLLDKEFVDWRVRAEQADVSIGPR